ncbi:MAG: cytochrome c biogenesis protein CcsA, partial [Planctomycetes bacterium]|nr:cytochrome c biogenesis protein CcsA [Planctomycetota bacterium]
MKLTLLLVIAQADIGVQHEGRVKPLDTFARQLMQFLSEKETFLGDPVEAILSLARRPEEGRSKRLIKITHPELKERFALDRALTHYSLADLEPARPRMAAEAAEIDEEEATSRERATLKVLHQYGMIEALSRERLLTIIPIPHGENHAWLTPTDVRAWLGGQSHPVIDEFVAQDPSRREALRDVVARWDGEQVAGLAERLRALNPKVYPAADRVQTELLYNRLRPFHKASALYFAAALGFLLAMVFQSRKTGWVAMGVHGLGLGLTLYGYALRWTIAGRYPLSNHYESMVMCALGAALFVPILEAWVKAKGVAGMSGALVASVLLVLANNVPAFAEQGFVAPLVPALQTVWMTIHVPVIMVGYAMGMLLMVLGHVALGQSFRAAGPSAHLDAILYRVLQLTALFLLVGI